MSPIEFQEARLKLGLDRTQCAAVLGMAPKHGDRNIRRIETGPTDKPVPEHHRRLLEAYLSGYRPADWPLPTKEALK